MSLEDVRACLEGRLVPALIGEKTEIALAAMISYCLICMWPEIDEDQRIEGVKYISGAMVMYLDSLANPGQVPS